MADEFVICTKSELVAIADAVRAKSGSSGTLMVSELPQAVSEAGGGYEANLVNITYETTNDEPVIITYAGLDADGNIRWHSTAEGTSGSFTAIANSIADFTATNFNSMADTYASISNIYAVDELGNSVYCALATHYGDYSYVFTNLPSDNAHVTIDIDPQPDLGGWM